MYIGTDHYHLHEGLLSFKMISEHKTHTYFDIGIFQ